MGADEDKARKIFDAYLECGGNFIDTANQYTEGSSEQLLGKFTEARRESLVLATKYTMLRRPNDPNSGGNHRKSMVASVEASLRRLRTDYLDVLHLHARDFRTPVQEILRAMGGLVRAGKVLYVAISDAPAWQVARMQAIADLRGWSPLIALQIEYRLIERTAERDLMPMAEEMGLGVIPWSPLGNGVLSGKYTAVDLDYQPTGTPSGTRKDVAAANNSLTARGLAIAEVVKQVATQPGRAPAPVAVAWTLHNPSVAVAATLVGARTAARLTENLRAR